MESKGLVARVAAPIGAAMALYHMYVIAFGPPEAMIFRAIHLSFAVALILLLFPFAQNAGRRHFIWLDALSFAVAAMALGHVFWSIAYSIHHILHISICRGSYR